MGRRRPERDIARRLWEESRGKKSIRELAEELGISEGQLRKWKSQDKWTPVKARGAPKGNQNARGHKGPAAPTGVGNRNAQTHGAYAAPDESRFTPEETQTVESIRDQLLRAEVAKYFDLQHRIEEIRADQREKYVTGGIDSAAPMEYWDSKDRWLETLENRSLRILARIQKFMDLHQARLSMESHERLTEKSIRLQREKAMGIFETDENEPPE